MYFVRDDQEISRKKKNKTTGRFVLIKCANLSAHLTRVEDKIGKISQNLLGKKMRRVTKGKHTKSLASRGIASGEKMLRAALGSFVNSLNADVSI